MKATQIVHFERDFKIRKTASEALVGTRHKIVEAASTPTEATDIIDAIRNGELDAQVLLVGLISNLRSDASSIYEPKSAESMTANQVQRLAIVGLSLVVIKFSTSDLELSDEHKPAQYYDVGLDTTKLTAALDEIV